MILCRIPILLLIGLLCRWSVFPAPTGTTVSRVAWFDFHVSPSGARHEATARELAALLQGQVRVPGVEFVERSELTQSEQELRLGLLGFAARTDLLRAGRWLRADFAVRGNLFNNPGGTWELQLELIDLARAEILQRTNAFLSGMAGSSLLAAATTAIPTAMVADWLQAAHQDRLNTRDWVKIAVLPQTPDSETLAGRLAGLTQGGPVRISRLSRAGSAVDEADLALGGLTEFDGEAWLKVADYYVWTESGDPAGSLRVWNGRTEPWLHQRFMETPKGSENAWWERPSRLPPKASVRESIASQLAEAGWRLGAGDGVPILSEPQRLADWFHAVWMLEAAVFFDPANAVAHEAWARLRFDLHVEDRCRSRFAFRLQRAAAWQRHVGRFGFASRLRHGNPGTRRGTVTGIYFASQDMVGWRSHGDPDPGLTESEAALLHGAVASRVAAAWLACTNAPERDRYRGVILDRMPYRPGETRPMPFARERLAALRDVWQRFPPVPYAREFLLEGLTGNLRILASDAGEPQVVEELLQILREASGMDAKNRRLPQPSESRRQPQDDVEVLPRRLPSPASPP